MRTGKAAVVIVLLLMVGSKGRQTPLRGGIPLYANGKCVGAIGVSNGTEEQDTDVALAGAAALESFES